MLKKSARCVLASFIGSTYRQYVLPLLSLRPYWTDFLSILPGTLVSFETTASVTLSGGKLIFQEPVRGCLMSALLQHFARSFSAFPVADGDRVVVAVSGGADSICLLHLLRQLATRRPLLLHVAHLNHRFRPEAEEEAAFVASMAERWGLPVTLSSQPIGALSKSLGLGKQEGARHLRYLFLKETAQVVDARWIATAHTADDQAETYLMRLLRGAGARGLASIPPVRDGRILRPLLGITREAIEAELRRNGIQWREDPSNRSPVYLRNRIRHQLLPMLALYNPNIRATLCRQARLLREEDDWMTQETLRQAENIAKIGESEIIFPLDRFAPLPRAMQRRLLRWGIDHFIQQGRRTVTFEQIERLLDLTVFPEGKRMNLPAGLRAERQRDRLVLMGEGAAPVNVPESVEIASADTAPIYVASWGLRFSFHPASPSDIGTPSPCCVAFDRDKLIFPLTLRGFHSGDRLTPFGMKGSKKLHDFFIDAKVPRRLRRAIPLLISQSRIAWIVGHRADATFVATPTTLRVLIIRVEPAETVVGRSESG
jgi:tRNA(Ile)-lysidine synthase